MGTLVCRIELNKEDKKGITITVTGEKITQTVHMDGTTITTRVKGDKETSTITQDQEKIAIKCKTFTLDAETITCTSTKATKHESKDTMDLLSTKDMTLDSKAKLVQKATNDVTVDGMNVKCNAKTNFEAKGKAKCALEGTANAELKGAQCKVTGTAQVTVSAPMGSVKSDGILTVEGQLTSVKGQITNVQGSLVKLG